MIVRIQQFQVSDSERFAGWPDSGPTGPIRYAWPAGTNAFEISILESDEQQHAVATGERRAHLRAAIGPIADALRAEGDELVARLDGPLAPGELFAACKYLTDEQGGGRFAISPAAKLDRAPAMSPGGIRIEMTAASLAALCADPGLGIDRGVRLRVFSIPAALVNPLLDTAELDDERWAEIMPQTTFVLRNTHGLDAVHVVTRLGPEEFSAKLGSRLGGQVQSSIKSPR
jgi:hypothetical protein